MTEWGYLDNYWYPMRINREGVLQMHYKGAWRTKNLTHGSTWVTPRYSVRLKDGSTNSRMPSTLIAEAFDNVKPFKQNNRVIEKIDRYGNVLATYKTIIEAANDNYVSRYTVQYRCSGKLTTDPFRLSDFHFRYNYKED